MSATRRDFLRTSALVSLGLLTGDAALEAFARLAPRRLWTGANLTGTTSTIRLDHWREVTFTLSDADLRSTLNAPLLPIMSDTIKAYANEIDRYIFNKHLSLFSPHVRSV